MKEKLVTYYNNLRLFYRSPIHIHSLTELQLMSVKQCVACGRIVEMPPTGELLSEPLQQAEGIKQDYVPLEGKNALERSYEGQVRSILSRHGVMTNDGWDFVTDELVNDLANWKRGSKARAS